MRDFVRGTGDLSRGLAAIRRCPGAWPWLLAPAVVTLASIAAAILAIARVVQPLVAWATGHLPRFLAGLGGVLLEIAIVVVLGLGALVIFTAVAGAIAGPFNEHLSERIESHLTGRPAPAFSLRRFLHELSLGIAHGVRRVLAAILAALAVFAVGLVPGVGPIAALVLGFWFAARGAAYDCYDAVLARRAMAYRAKLAFLAEHRARSLGLGVAVAALLLVPGLNLVALGLGAAGATVAASDPRLAGRSG